MVAANRDELRGRPGTSPHLWPHEGFLAPRDEQAGGTWLGLNRHGLFVGVTNRFGAEKDPTRASRGTLVVEALRAPSARALHAELAATPPRRFNAFHLLYTDGADAFVTWCDGEALFQRTLDEGLHVVTERSLGGDDRARTELITARYPRRAADGVPDFGPLEALLATPHADDPFGGVCVDLPAFDYGTRSSLVLALARPLGESRWAWADGRPDRTPFVEAPALVSALAGLGVG